MDKTSAEANGAASFTSCDDGKKLYTTAAGVSAVQKLRSYKAGSHPGGVPVWSGAWEGRIHGRG